MLWRRAPSATSPTHVRGWLAYLTLEGGFLSYRPRKYTEFSFLWSKVRINKSDRQLFRMVIEGLATGRKQYRPVSVCYSGTAAWSFVMVSDFCLQGTRLQLRRQHQLFCCGFSSFSTGPPDKPHDYTSSYLMTASLQVDNTFQFVQHQPEIRRYKTELLTASLN